MGFEYAARLPDSEYWVNRIPCQMACPVKTDAGRYVQLIVEGEDRESYLCARSPNPLASVCGRICAAPCEDHCRRGRFDGPVSIRALKRFVTERFGVESRQPETFKELFEGGGSAGNRWSWHDPRPGAAEGGEPSGRKVAVIGAGPAGLACAHDLALQGHSVTVFEASRRAGGMAFHGIPEFRLPASLLEKEILAIEELGVEFRYEAPLARGFGLRQLREMGFEGFFLAVGAQKGRMLQCPGSDLDGVIKAVDYLININNGYRVPQGRKVLVVGGGFVAFDAARMALRAGGTEQSVEEEGGGMKPALDAARLAARAGAEVTLASLESFQEMPVMRTEQGREEFAQAREEGIQFLPQRSVARIEGPERASKVHMIGVKRTYDEEGRFDPQFDESVEQEMEADLVILAIGQQPDLDFLTPEDGIDLTPGGTVKVDPDTLATSAPDVFAGGDVAFGPRNLIDAVANGKRAAQGIDRFLTGRSAGPGFVFRFEKIPTRQFRRSEFYDLLPRKAPPTTRLDRRTGISEVEEGYDDENARLQAERCLFCHIQTVYDAEKCVLCNRCVDICPVNCLKLVPLDQAGLPDDQVEPARQAGGAAEGIASAMLKDDEICIRCGLCAVRCPTDAMTMEVLHYEQR